MDDLEEQFARRDRFRRRLALRATPQERVRDMMRHVKLGDEASRMSPEGYAAFIRRNFKARAIRVRDIDAV